jgi:hypothetical protein
MLAGRVRPTFSVGKRLFLSMRPAGRGITGPGKVSELMTYSKKFYIMTLFWKQKHHFLT